MKNVTDTKTTTKKCNTPIDPETKIALHGDILEAALQDPQSPRCGHELEPEDVFCPSCGARVIRGLEGEQPCETGTEPINQGTIQEGTPPVIYSSKERGTYRLLAFLLGGFGVHNFYAGRYGWAIGQLLLWILIFSLHIISGSKMQPSSSFALNFPLLMWVLADMLCVDNDGKGLPFAIKSKTISPLFLQAFSLILGIFSLIASDEFLVSLIGTIVSFIVVNVSITGLKNIKQTERKTRIIGLCLAVLGLLMSIIAIPVSLLN